MHGVWPGDRGGGVAQPVTRLHLVLHPSAPLHQTRTVGSALGSGFVRGTGHGEQLARQAVAPFRAGCTASSQTPRLQFSLRVRQMSGGASCGCHADGLSGRPPSTSPPATQECLLRRPLLVLTAQPCLFSPRCTPTPHGAAVVPPAHCGTAPALASTLLLLLQPRAPRSRATVPAAATPELVCLPCACSLLPHPRVARLWGRPRAPCAPQRRPRRRLPPSHAPLARCSCGALTPTSSWGWELRLVPPPTARSRRHRCRWRRSCQPACDPCVVCTHAIVLSAAGVGSVLTCVLSSGFCVFPSQVACGTQHTIVATDAGEVFSWGSSDYGALGLRNTELGDAGSGDKATGDLVTVASSPRLVDVLLGQDIVSVAAGAYHSAAVSSEGDVYTWGWGGSFLSGASTLIRCPSPRPLRCRRGGRGWPNGSVLARW